MTAPDIPPALRPLAAQSPYVGAWGTTRAPLVLVGEAPGQQEAEQLVPFVGPAGKLLNRALAAAGIARSMCYITNAVKYRPPLNRTPYQFEIAASRPSLLAEIAAVRPVAVAALGMVARGALLPGLPARLGLFTELQLPGGLSVPVLVTRHPSYALREGPAEEEVLSGHLRMLIEGPYVYAGT